MKRYLNAFLLTTVIYSALVALFIFAIFEIKKPILKNENIIVLNHISLVEQKKIIKKEKLVKKEKIVKKEKKIKRVRQKLLEVKKVEKISKKLVTRKEVVKAVETKKVKKEETQPKIVKSIITRTYRQNFEDEYLRKIVKLIQKNIKYPKRAKVMHIQGRVVIEFLLKKEGGVSAFKIISGHKLLNKATIKAIKTASSYFPKVKKNILLKVPIVFTLS